MLARVLAVVVCLSVCCVTFAESEPYCHSRMFVCLSGCLSVIPRPTAYHDWSITTKFGRQVYTCPRTRLSVFLDPVSPILSVSEGKICNAYSCHRERDASCHMTCLSVCLSVCHTPVLYRNGCTDRAGFLAYGLPSTFATLVLKELWYLQCVCTFFRWSQPTSSSVYGTMVDWARGIVAWIPSALADTCLN